MAFKPVFDDEGAWTDEGRKIASQFDRAIYDIMRANPDVSPRDLAYIANNSVAGEHLIILATQIKLRRDAIFPPIPNLDDEEGN